MRLSLAVLFLLLLGLTLGHAKSPEAEFSAGRQAFNNGEFATAIEHWQIALAGFRNTGNDPAIFDTALHLASAQQRIGNYPAVAQILGQILTEVPPGSIHHVQALGQLSMLYLAEGQLKRVEEGSRRRS